MKRRIIIDTDPGQDDAVAILLALASPDEIEVVGIVAVAGNVPLAHTERNARRIVELAGRPDVPVYAGCARPMMRSLVTAEHVHGRTGPRRGRPARPASQAATAWRRFHRRALIAAEPGSITLACSPSLTSPWLVKAPGGGRHPRS
jgi:purine nucleosidase